ncbi:PQQ-binding-like beta-propeller repeat protein [Brevibacillus centrosporus]|uniref:outer membrane protein assembly factor BamB family protein n=1 Tax=Brevibacillus centrosporus TaxID=54910 RepID=UPI003D1EDAE1
MKRKWFKKVTTAVIATLLLVASVLPAAADYPMYSGDPTRTRNILDPSMDTPILYKWNLKLGWSVTQPITATDSTGTTYIYQIAATPDSNNDFQLPAGSYLYRIPVLTEDTSKMSKADVIALMASKGARYVRLGPYVKTYSHVTWSKENKHFYVGWGQGSNSKVYAINEDLTGTQVFSLGDTPIASPMVYPNDIFVIGTMDGKITAVKGLASGKFASRQYIFDSASNAEITAHMTGIPGTMIFATGLNFRKSSQKGKFQLFQLVDQGKDLLGNPKQPIIYSTWPSHFITNTGVATDAAYEGNVFYFSDKGGTFYAVTTAGQQKWKQRHSEIPVSLVNNSPAMGTDNIYFPIRQPGGVAAIKKSNGDFYWYAKQGMDKTGQAVDANVKTGRLIENNTTIWKTRKGKAFVLYGDDAGQLVFLDFAGNRSEITKTADGKPQASITLASDPSVPPDRQDWTVQGKGLSTEIVIDSGHLLFGVNSGETGTLWAYSINGGNDLALEFDRNYPSEPPQPGEAGTYVQLKLRHNMGIAAPFKTKLKYTFDMVNYLEQEVTVYPKESYPDGQPIQVFTPFAVPSKPYPFWAEINPDDKFPEKEQIRSNNIVNVMINPQSLDLSLIPDSWRLTIDTPKKNVAFGVYVKAHMEHLSGVKAPIKTVVALKLNGKIEDEIEINISPGQTLEVGPFWVTSSSSMTTMSAEINPYRDRPSWEPDWENNKIQERIYLRDGIDLYVSSLKPPNKIVKGQIIQVEAIVGNGELSVQDTPNALVRFYFDGKLEEERRISLSKGEVRRLVFDHRVPNFTGNHIVSVSINEDFLYPELTYVNNILNAGIYVGETDLVPINAGDTNYPSDIVHVECDADGNCTYYYEYLDMEIVNWKKRQVKAGQALDFQVKTEYYTEWGAYKDVQRVYAVFPAPAGQSPIVVDLVPDRPSSGAVSSSTKLWRFPQTWIEKWSGKEFHDPTDPEIDPREELLDGGKKYYTPMKIPDGPYTFKIVAERAGKNNLRRYVVDTADIVGGFDTFTSKEHYVRPAIPYSDKTAFPFGASGYWADKEGIILGLNSWYNGPMVALRPEEYDDLPLVIQNNEIVGGTIAERHNMDSYTDLLEMYEKEEE